MKTKILAFVVLLSTMVFGQAPSKVTTLAGTTSPASFYIQNNGHTNGNPATFMFPVAVAVKPNGDVFTVEQDFPSIRKITPSGVTSEYVGNSTFVSPSYTGFGNVDGSLSTARFGYCSGLASDALGNIYVADTENHSVRKITTTTVSTLSSDFVQPNALCVDGSGNIYVADNNRIRKISPVGVVTTITGSTTAGNANGALILARFRSIEGIAVDNTGTILYASDSGNGLLRKINLTTGTVSTVSVSESFYTLITPSGLAFYNGNLFIADRGGNVIFKMTASGVVSRYAGNGLAKFRDGLSNADRFGASLYAPQGIAVDANGNLYVADRNNQRIRKIEPLN